MLHAENHEAIAGDHFWNVVKQVHVCPGNKTAQPHEFLLIKASTHRCFVEDLKDLKASGQLPEFPLL